MEKPNIGLDVDEVLADFSGSFLDFLNNKHGANWKKNNIANYAHFANDLGISLENINQELNDFYVSAYFGKIKPVKGSIEGVKELNKKGLLYVITGRNQKIKKKTEEWIERYFDFSFEKIYFSDMFVNQKNECHHTLKGVV